MSYILDALRRAQAERGRGTVPGLHTPVVPFPGAAGTAEATRVAGGTIAMAVVAGACVVALVAGGIWWAVQRAEPTGNRPVDVAALPASAVVPQSVTRATTPPVAAASLPADTTPSDAQRPSASPVSPVARSEVRSVTPPARPVASEKPVRVDNGANGKASSGPMERATAQQRPKSAAASGPAPAPLAVAAPAIATATPSSPPARVPITTPAPVQVPAPVSTVFAPADLPAAVRAQLPVLQISGVTYSSNALYRMAIVNGQVLHEGDPAAPGLRLEKVEPGRTIWSFQGYRYALASQ